MLYDLSSCPQGTIWRGESLFLLFAPWKTDLPNTFPLLFFPYIPTLRTLVTLARGAYGCVNHVWKSSWLQPRRQTDLNLLPPTFTHGQLKIKSPLWSQAWNSIPLVKLESLMGSWSYSPAQQSSVEDTLRTHGRNWCSFKSVATPWAFICARPGLVTDEWYRDT